MHRPTRSYLHACLNVFLFRIYCLSVSDAGSKHCTILEQTETTLLTLCKKQQKLLVNTRVKKNLCDRVDTFFADCLHRWLLDCWQTWQDNCCSVAPPRRLAVKCGLLKSSGGLPTLQSVVDLHVHGARWRRKPSWRQHHHETAALFLIFKLRPPLALQ